MAKRPTSYPLAHRFAHLFAPGDARNAPDVDGGLLFDRFATPDGRTYGMFVLAPFEYVYDDTLFETLAWYWAEEERR